LAIVSRTRERLDAMANKLKALGATDVLVLALDMSKDKDAVAAVTRTVEHFNRTTQSSHYQNTKKPFGES
jgi:short-subunit dehydrogenase